MTYLLLNNKSKKLIIISTLAMLILNTKECLVVEKYIKKISSNFYRDISDWHNKFSNLNAKIDNWWLYPYTRITAWYPQSFKFIKIIYHLRFDQCL